MNKAIVNKKRTIYRLLVNLLAATIFIILALGLGMWGYHRFEKMPWIDAFANAAMILSGMGPLVPMQTFAGKLFAGCYALFSGLTFVAAIAVVFAPLIHIFLRKIHLENISKNNVDSE